MERNQTYSSVQDYDLAMEAYDLNERKEMLGVSFTLMDGLFLGKIDIKGDDFGAMTNFLKEFEKFASAWEQSQNPAAR